MSTMCSSSTAHSPSLRVMAPRAYIIVATASGAVLAAMVAATLATGPILGGQHLSRAPTPPATEPTRHPAVVPANDGGIPTWLTVTMTILLAIYAVALLVLAWFHQRGREERETLSESADDHDLNGAWRTILPVDLGNAAEAQLALLHVGTPRNAIVACWMALRTATMDAGLPTVASETSEELVVRAMRSLGLDPASIRDLASLYREARFSEHVMKESDRDRAGRALRVLADQLAPGRTTPDRTEVLEDVTR